MIIRTIGAALVVSAMTSLGWARAAALRRRPKTLQLLSDALDVLKIESCVNLLPLSEALLCAANAVQPPVRTLFLKLCTEMGSTQPFKVLWNEEISELPYINAYDRQLLQQLGTRLGCVSAEAQCESLKACILELRAKAKESDAEAKSAGKLSKSICLICGALLAVTLY